MDNLGTDEERDFRFRLELLEDDCLLNIRQGSLELAILLILNSAGDGGLPVKLITKLSLWTLYGESENGLLHLKKKLEGSVSTLKSDVTEKIERALSVLIQRKLDSWDRSISKDHKGYIIKAPARAYANMNGLEWKKVGMEKSPGQTYRIEPDGKKALRMMMEEAKRIHEILVLMGDDAKEQKVNVFQHLMEKGEGLKR
ncbi:hypothetical protein EBR21_15540 [bacterium]|nr:hypothetical protein [bacterium]